MTSVKISVGARIAGGCALCGVPKYGKHISHDPISEYDQSFGICAMFSLPYLCAGQDAPDLFPIELSVFIRVNKYSYLV